MIYLIGIITCRNDRHDVPLTHPNREHCSWQQKCSMNGHGSFDFLRGHCQPEWVAVRTKRKMVTLMLIGRVDERRKSFNNCLHGDLFLSFPQTHTGILTHFVFIHNWVHSFVLSSHRNKQHTRKHVESYSIRSIM